MHRVTENPHLVSREVTADKATAQRPSLQNIRSGTWPTRKSSLSFISRPSSRVGRWWREEGTRIRGDGNEPVPILVVDDDPVVARVGDRLRRL